MFVIYLLLIEMVTAKTVFTTRKGFWVVVFHLWHEVLLSSTKMVSPTISFSCFAG